MTEPPIRVDMAASASQRLPMMLRVAHWELLIVSALLVGIFALRQTGNLPGVAIRILDVVFVATTLGLTMHAARVDSRTRVGWGVVAMVSIVIPVAGVATESIATQRIASGLSAYVLVAILKKHLHLETSLNRILQVLSVSLFEQVPIPEKFTEARYREDGSDSCNQLTLWDF